MAGPMMSAPVSATQIAQQSQDQGAQQLKQGASKFDGVMANKAQASQAAQQANATQATQAAQHASSTTAASKATSAQMVQHLQKADAAKFRKVDASRESQGASNEAHPDSEFQILGGRGAGPITAGGPVKAAPTEMSRLAGAGMSSGVSAPGGNMAMKMMGEIEKGQGVLDQLIKMGASGKNFSNGELISMQAMVYKYSQELELTGKVVEKATSGLKDTLKTQV